MFRITRNTTLISGVNNHGIHCGLLSLQIITTTRDEESVHNNGALPTHYMATAIFILQIITTATDEESDHNNGALPTLYGYCYIYTPDYHYSHG